jgi:hypothetical protein
MGRPHAVGTVRHICKQHVAADKTFAFGVVGRTLSAQEMGILEQIIAETFKKPDAQKEVFFLTHQDWFAYRDDITLFVLTKNDAFYMKELNGDGEYLVKCDPTHPVGSGTGFYVASMAVLEGVAMKDVTSIVAEIVITVSPEGDLVHRDDLVEFAS